MAQQLFDAATFTPTQASGLVNIPGQSLADTNSVSAIQNAQSLNPSPNIPAYKVAPTTPIVPAPNQSSPDWNSILASTNTAQTAVDATEKSLNDANTQLGQQSADTATFQDQFGVNSDTAALRDLNAQLASVNNEAAAANLNVDRVGRPAVLTSEADLEKSNIERDRTIKALGLSASIQAMNGNLQTANDQVARAIALKYDPIKSQITNLTNQLNDNYKSLTAAQKVQADAIKADNDAKLKVLDNTIATAKNWETNKNTALSNNAPLKLVQSAQALFDAGQEDQARALLANYTGTKSYNTSTPTETAAAKLKTDSSKIGTYLSGKTGTDGYASPQDYQTARAAWVSDGYSASDFDTRFDGFVNPSHAQDYGVKWKLPTSATVGFGSVPATQ